jgi:hypothetical protein
MQFSDLLVIYLAIGAPLAVYTVSIGREQRMLSLAKGAFSGLIWPVSGIARLISSRHDGVNELVFPGERMTHLFSGEPVEAVFALREAIDRYTSLWQASFEIGTAGIEGLSDIGMIRQPNAAIAIARRVQRSRIERHLAAARLDLMTALAAIPHADHFCRDLADDLGDHEMKLLLVSPRIGHIPHARRAA